MVRRLGTELADADTFWGMVNYLECDDAATAPSQLFRSAPLNDLADSSVFIFGQ